MTNGVDVDPFADWHLVLAAGGAFVGKLVLGKVLDPAYQLSCGMQMMPAPCMRCRGAGGSPLTGACKACGGRGVDASGGSQLMVQRSAQPILTFHSWTSLTLPSECICKPIRELSARERSNLIETITKCEKIVESMRADDAGVTLAPAALAERVKVQ